MIKTLSKYILASAAIAVVGCSDFLDKDNPAYDNVGFYKSEAGLKEGVTGTYQKLYFDMNWSVPACIVLDHYTAYGLERKQEHRRGRSVEPRQCQNPSILVWRIRHNRTRQLCDFRC